MKIKDFIKQKMENGTMTRVQNAFNERTANKYNRATTQGALNIEYRDLIKSFGGYPTSVGELQDKYGAKDVQDPFISRITTYEDLNNDISCPYLSPDGIEWKEAGQSAEGQQSHTESEKLHPHRLTTQVAISREVLMSNTEIEEQLKATLIKAMYGKVVESILCDFSGSTDQPKGIFYEVSAATISSLDDLNEMQYQGDSNKSQNVWVISPRAKKEINALNYDLLRDNKLLNSEYLCDNRAQSPYIAYLPLELVNLAIFGAVSITVDTVTQLVNGKVLLTIDFYVDFAYLDKSLIKLGVFDESQNNTTPTEGENETEG